MITYTSATKKIAEEAFQAALLGDLDKVKQLAGHTFHLETCDEKGNSLLHYAVRSKKTITVRGAKTLSFREPEGIKVLAGGQIYMMYVSNTLTNQSCNIYRVKRKI